MKTLIKITILSMAISWNGLQAQEIKADSANGAQVWSAVCMRCHNLRQPADLSTRAWKFSMNHMRIRAGLTGQETRDVQAFIIESKSDQDSK
ncbi:MAG: hypothetical protein MUP09_06350 [Thiovulaceae bacterium]|nr:hypothetical protein [Sulfurimonadaceae bacterium]